MNLANLKTLLITFRNSLIAAAVAPIAFLTIATPVARDASAQYSIRAMVIPAAGSASSPGVEIRALVGQSAAGIATHASMEVSTGFLRQIEALRRADHALSTPAAPTLLSPADGALDLIPPVTLIWSSIEEAETYRLQVALDVEFETLVIDVPGLTEPSFEAGELLPGVVYYWRVRAENAAGSSTDAGPAMFSTATTVGTDQLGLPTRYSLDQNYPNPFNPSTRIRFTLPEAASVELSVYDVLGRRVTSLVDETRAAGTHEVIFDAGDLSSGTYLIRLIAGSLVETRSAVLLR